MKPLFKMFTALVLLTGCDQAVEDKTKSEDNLAISQNSFDKTELDTILNQYKNNDNFMGSVAILKDGSKVYSYVTGYSDYKSGQLATSETKYRIGSITKTFTALLTLMAYEEGKLPLGQTLDKFYPNIKNSDKITIEQMLNHRSGIHSYTRDPKFFEYIKTGVSVEEMLRNLSSYPSDFEPDTKEAYSNSNAYLLTLILEEIYQQPYAELIESKISKPLALNNTYYANEISSANGEAYSYHDQETMEPDQDIHHSIMLGAGGLVSTPTDIAIFFNALLSGKILKQDTLNKLLSFEGAYGLGVEKFTFSGKESYGHRGRVLEFNSIALYNPEEGISIAIIDNSSFSQMPAITKDILNSYFKDAPISISVEELDMFVGTYTADDEDNKPEFERDGDKLIHVIAGEYRSELIYLGNYKFLLDQSYAPAITFTFAPDGSKLIFEHKGSEWEYYKQTK